jgi:hypothetical protein
MSQENLADAKRGSQAEGILGTLATVRKVAVSRLFLPVSTFVAGLALYLVCRPALPNGDGVGYLRAARAGGFAPGHLLYVPLLRLLGEPLLGRAQFASAVCGALGLALVAWRASVWAAVGLAVSWAYLCAASDVESYAPATLALICVLVARRPAVRVAAAVVAILLHLEHVMLLPFLALEVGASGALLAAGLAGGAYAIVTLGVLHLPVRSALAWVLSAQHGFREALWKAPVAAVFGAARALAQGPYPYEAPPGLVLAQAAVGAVGIAVLVAAAGRDPPPLGMRPRAALALLVAYGVLALLFFPSEPERWLFLLPLGWVWAVPALRRAPQLAAIGLSVLLLYNLVLGVRPRADPAPALKVRAARAVLAPGDLVVAPGHGWDEYLDLDGPLPRDAELFLLSFYAGRDGDAAALAHLRDAAAHARRVVLLRFVEDHDPQGWKELRRLGLDRARIRQALSARELERLAPDVYAVTRNPAKFGLR